MARSGFFDTIFAGNSRGESVIRNLWINQLEKDDAKERKAAKRLLDWYNRDRAALVDYLTEAARKTFGDQVNDWQWPLINGVPRVIKRISLAYMAPPERKLMRRGKPVEADSKEYAAVFGENGLYSKVDINRKMKEIDRYSTLFNTAHIEIVPRHGRIDWDIRLRPGVIVVEDPDDYLRFQNFAYEFNPLDPNTLKPRVGWVYWTKTEHKYLMANGDPVGMSLEDGSNPYGGEIPIVTVRKLIQDSYWGTFGADLVDAFEHANLQLANMWENGFMQTHGQAFGVNLGLGKGATLVTGPKNPILVENVGKDDIPPDLRFVKPDADIAEVKELIDWYIKSAGQSYGLPPSSWSLDEVAESGFAKMMKNIELFEDRDDSQAMWIETESELFVKSRMVWNRWAGENKVEKIPEDLELQVAFQPVEMPEAPGEKATRYTMGIKAGISSPVRYFMQEEGLDREAAIAKAKEIEEENEMFKGSSPADDFLSGFIGAGRKPASNSSPDETNPGEGEEE